MLKITIKVASDAAPWGVVNNNRRLEGAYWFHIQTREVQEATVYNLYILIL